MNLQSFSGLPSRYRNAISEAIAVIETRFNPLGIVVTGTIIRGHPHATSDLDIVVIHRETWRQRIQIWCGDVPAEIFVNSAPWIERAFQTDTETARPVMIGMLSTGVIIKDTDNVLVDLVIRARELFDAGPQASELLTTPWRYGIASLLEDAGDIRNEDMALSSAMVTEALLDAIRYSFVTSGIWIPREKALLRTFYEERPDLAQATRAALGSDLNLRFDLSKMCIESLIGTSGFFPWESPVQELP
jgi:hypothetical protein